MLLKTRLRSSPSETKDSFWPLSQPRPAIDFLEALRQIPGGEEARIIGTIQEQPAAAVLVTTRYGGTRIVDMLVGDPLPRICTKNQAWPPNAPSQPKLNSVYWRAIRCSSLSSPEKPLNSPKLLAKCPTAFWGGACSRSAAVLPTDAQHVSVEFVHPVIVGKRALPALDLSILFRPWLQAIVTSSDIVMGFGPPEGDPEVWEALELARSQGAMTFALPGLEGSYAVAPQLSDPFLHGDVEILYHTLWETIMLEHRELGQDVGQAGFLYPFLGQEKPGSYATR